MAVIISESKIIPPTFDFSLLSKFRLLQAEKKQPKKTPQSVTLIN